MVENCMLFSEEKGYKEAKLLLEERFGNKYKYPVPGLTKYSIAH